MPKANREAKPENVATLTPYVDEQQRLVVVLGVSRGVARAFAVVPPNRGALTLERTQREAAEAATAWARERGGEAQWRTPKQLPLRDGRDICTALEMVRSDVA